MTLSRFIACVLVVLAAAAAPASPALTCGSDNCMANNR